MTAVFAPASDEEEVGTPVLLPFRVDIILAALAAVAAVVAAIWASASPAVPPAPALAPAREAGQAIQTHRRARALLQQAIDPDRRGGERVVQHGRDLRSLHQLQKYLARHVDRRDRDRMARGPSPEQRRGKEQ